MLSVAPGLNQPTLKHTLYFYKHVTEGVGSYVHDVVQQLGHHSLLYNLQMVPAFPNEKKPAFLLRLVHLLVTTRASAH